MNPPIYHRLTILEGDTKLSVEVKAGSKLRDALLAAGYSPYTSLTQWANCGGRGLCATCGVWLQKNGPSPTHWHDRLADQFGYPRLSCQVRVEAPMTVEILTDKWIWGKRKPKR
jgi:ferredoxin